jgi:hypothetical protein
MTESPTSSFRSPSPARPREAPPVALNNRPAMTSTENDGDILVKPPSRRESLQNAARASSDSMKPPVSPTTSVQRAPSPVKPRTVASPEHHPVDGGRGERRQSALPPTSTPASGAGMAGVGALGRNSVPVPNTNKPTPIPEPSTGSNESTNLPTAPSLPLTAQPTRIRPTPPPNGGLKPVPPTDGTATSRENGIHIPTAAINRNMIPEKTPLARPPVPATPSKIPTTASTSATKVPVKESVYPGPSSSASSAATVRQSRVAAVAVGAQVAQESTSAHKEDVTPAKQTAYPTAPTAPEPQHTASSRIRAEASFSPSRQSSNASASSSSAPSATFSRSTATSPSGLNTPEDLSSSKNPEPREVKKITLSRGSTKINGVTYSHDNDTTPPGTAAPQPNGTRGSTTTSPPTSPRGQERERRSENRIPAQSAPLREQKEKVLQPTSESPDQGVGDPTPEQGGRSSGPTAAQIIAREAAQRELASPRPSISEQSDGRISPQHVRPRGEKRSSRSHRIREPQPEPEPELEPEPEIDPNIVYPIERHLENPDLLACLLDYIQFSELLALSSSSKTIRNMLEDKRELREEVLERFLGTVGYMRWDFGKKREPLVLTLRVSHFPILSLIILSDQLLGS